MKCNTLDSSCRLARFPPTVFLFFSGLDVMLSNALSKISSIFLTSISSTGSYLVLSGEPINESVVRYGPFVTNTEGDMKQAMLDYQNGKMGTLS